MRGECQKMHMLGAIKIIRPRGTCDIFLVRFLSEAQEQFDVDQLRVGGESALLVSFIFSSKAPPPALIFRFQLALTHCVHCVHTVRRCM